MYNAQQEDLQEMIESLYEEEVVSDERPFIEAQQSNQGRLIRQEAVSEGLVQTCSIMIVLVVLGLVIWTLV